MIRRTSYKGLRSQNTQDVTQPSALAVNSRCSLDGAGLGCARLAAHLQAGLQPRQRLSAGPDVSWHRRMSSANGSPGAKLRGKH